MRSVGLDRRRLTRLRSHFLAGRTSAQVVVGALAIAAIVLAFLFRPGQTAQDTRPAAAPPGPTAAATVGATVVPAALVPKPTAAPSPSPKQPQERIHTVGSGDTLSGLAQKYYGDASKHGKIYDANRDMLKDPNSLQVGQKLRIPD